MYHNTHVRINQNSHIAAMCETQNPVLCGGHFAEVCKDGDLLHVYDNDADAPCDACQMNEMISRGEN